MQTSTSSNPDSVLAREQKFDTTSQRSARPHGRTLKTRPWRVPKFDDLCLYPVSKLQLSGRAMHFLICQDISTIGQLIKLRPESIARAGQSILSDIERVLQEIGLALTQTPDLFTAVSQPTELKPMCCASFSEIPKRCADYLLLPIEALTFSVRSRNCLNAMGIHLVGDLVQKSERELLGQEFFGRTSLNEVKAVLASMGLSFSMWITDWPVSPPPLTTQHILQTVARQLMPRFVPRKWNRQYRGEIPAELLVRLIRRIDSLDLSARAAKVFSRLKLALVGDLVQRTEKELLDLKNFGQRTLKETKNILGGMGLSLGMRLPCWPPPDINSLHKVFRPILKKMEDREFRKASEGEHKAVTSTDDEIRTLLNLCRSERNRRIVSAFFGWDGTAGATLQAVGNKYGLTRERVRQICDRFAGKCGARHPNLKYLRKALRLVSQSVPVFAEHAEKTLKDAGLITSDLRIEGLLALRDMVGIRATFGSFRFGGRRMLAPSSYERICRAVALAAKKNAQHWGATTIADVEAIVRQNITDALPSGFVEMTLGSVRGFRWLDRETGWFCIDSTGKKGNRLLTPIKKMLAVSNGLHVSELRQGLQRDYRQSGFSPPSRVLSVLLQEVGGFEIREGRAFGQPQPDWHDVLSDVEKVIYSVLGEQGPILTYAQFEAECISRGMNAATFGAYATHSPIITRFGKGIYGLVGTTPPPGLVEDIASESGRTEVLQDYGWKDGCSIYAIYRLSSATLRSGVLSVPSSMSRFISGQFTLRDQDGVLLGTLTVKGSTVWTVKPFFSRRGGELSDILNLVFDVSKKQATVFLGDYDFQNSLPNAERNEDSQGLEDTNSESDQHA